MDSLAEVEAQESFRRDGDRDDRSPGDEHPPGPVQIIPYAYARPDLARHPERSRILNPDLIITAESFSDRRCVVCGRPAAGPTCRATACLEYLGGAAARAS
jgi:hypothetical protein